MNNEPLVSKRERELLSELEVIRRNKEKITVNSFCKRVRYANKSALRHFPVLRRELGLYIEQLRPTGRNGSPPSAVRHLEVQVGRLQRKCEKQEQALTEIPKLKKENSALRGELKQSRRISSHLRAMISTLTSYFSDNDLALAREISKRLEKIAREYLETDQPSDSIGKDTLQKFEE